MNSAVASRDLHGVKRDFIQSMCGIAGYIDLSGPPSRSVLEAMANSIAHRGPDASSIWLDDRAGLVHTRLSIIDLGHSHQPMKVENSVLTFNGEVYNYSSLRESLDPSNFSTNGDTEVLLRGLREHGFDFLSSIDGMFAFGLWDSEQGSLHLARDRYGKKPLFYAVPRDGLLVFGSEPKAILQHPEVGDALDMDALQQVVKYRAVYGSQSLYRDIHQVPAGGSVVWDGSRLTKSKWYDAACIAKIREPKFSLDELESTFMNSVAARLVSDVPVGAFLSGGIDSSLVVAAMRRLQPDQDIHTFSVSFAGDPDDEHTFASSVAERFSTLHHRIIVDEDDFISDMSMYSRLRDAPLSEPADLAVARMSRLARQHVKVVLSGEGADEAFAGYPKYQLAQIPKLVLPLLRAVPPVAAAKMAGILGMSSRRALVAINALQGASEIDRISRWFAAGSSERLASLFPSLSVVDRSNPSPQIDAFRRIENATGDAVRRMQFVDLETWLPGNLLERGDRMTMAEGLEARMPFMSEPMVSFGFSLSAQAKCSLRVTKKPLRLLAEKLVGEDIARRRKWGFRVPLADWFKSSLGDFLADHLEASESFVKEFGNPAEVRRLLREHRAGHADEHMVLWAILACEAWYQNRS
jgi:asparagine synthase (glutamine-hydrolysing)